MEREKFSLISFEITSKNEIKFKAYVDIVDKEKGTVSTRTRDEIIPNIMHNDAYDALNNFFNLVKDIIDVKYQLLFSKFSKTNKGIKFNGTVLRPNCNYKFRTGVINLNDNLFTVEAEMKAYLEVFEDEIFKYIFENKTGGEIAEID